MTFPLCRYSLTNMHSLLSPGHYHIHLARCCPLLPILPIHWPLGLPLSHTGHLSFHLFVSERLFWPQSPVEWWNQGTLELLQKRSLETVFELDLTCQTVPHLCVFFSFMHFSLPLTHSLMSRHAHNMHFCSQFLSELGSHTKKQFRKWFLLVVKL